MNMTWETRAMWMYTRYGFFSVVAESPPKRPGAIFADRPPKESRLVVRARCREHLETLLDAFGDDFVGKSPIEHTPDADYAYRTRLDRGDWAAIVAIMLEEIDYPNFKSAAHSAMQCERYDDMLHRTHAVAVRTYAPRKRGGR